jgi:hypothetical protein
MDDEFEFGADELDEIFSGDDIVGQEIVGADNKRKLYGQPQRGPRVVQTRANTLYRQLLPVPVTNVGIGATVAITMKPQRIMRVERLIVDAVVAPDFDIVSLNIGQENQYVANGVIPAGIFVPDAVGITLRGSTAGVGTEIVMEVKNNNAAAKNFKGAFIGTVLS